MTTSNDKPHLFTRVIKFLFILLVAIYLFIWIFSPLAVRHFAAEPLQEFGVVLTEDSSVRYNPFTSTLTVSQLALTTKGGSKVLSVDMAEISIHLHRLLFKQLYVSEFLLQGVSLKIIKDGQSILVAGFDIPAASEAEQVDDSTQQESEAASDFSVVIPKLTLNNILFDAQVDGAPQKLLLNKLSITNTELNQLAQQISLAIQAQVNDAPFSLISEIGLQAGKGAITSSFSLEQLNLQSINPLLNDLGMQVSGAFSVKGNANVLVSEDVINMDSEQIMLSVASLDLNYAPWIVEGKNDVVTIDNLVVEALPTGVIEHLSAKVATHLTEGNVGLESSENSVVNWSDLNISTNIELVDMQPKIVIDEINVVSLNLSEDRSLAEPSAIVAIAQLAISDLLFNDNQLKVDTISIAGLKTDIKVNADKSIVGLVDTKALDSEPQNEREVAESVSESTQSEQVIETTGDAQKLAIVLNKFMLADTAYIHINDQSVSPVFEKNITVETLQAGPFDSTNSSLESPFELVAKDDGYLKIAVNGHVSPFAEKLNGLFNININELDLPSVSPYVKDGLGFEMKTGQLDLGVEVAIQEGEIDGETKLFLRGVDMASADEVEQGAIKEGKAMPLNVALGLLKDDQGNIDLGVPMRGNVDDPSFGIESFLGLILKKAAMSQAKSYLMTTFVPYASVVSVAVSGAEYLLKVKFEPLVFNTGELVLSEDNQQYLSELVLLMQDKPELQLKTCSVGTYSELGLAPSTELNADQQAQLKAMGSERQENLKRYLIEQDIASSRILYCAPELDTADDALPRIELKTD